MEEERFVLGEKSNHMVTGTPFMGKLKVHIRQFYVNEKGEKKPGKKGIMLELEESEKLVNLAPKVRDSIARYELRDTGNMIDLKFLKFFFLIYFYFILFYFIFLKFYGRYQDLIEKYRRSVNAMVSDSFPGQFPFNM